MSPFLYEALSHDPQLLAAVQDMGTFQRLQRLPPFAGPKHAIRKMLRHEEIIRRAAAVEGVSLSALMAILFREALFFGLDDLLDGLRKGASRGVGQIKPPTAAKADAAAGLVPLSLEAYRVYLMEPAFNIACCARILRTELLSQGADPLSPSSAELEETYRRYTASSKYARDVVRYQAAIAGALNRLKLMTPVSEKR